MWRYLLEARRSKYAGKSETEQLKGSFGNERPERLTTTFLCSGGRRMGS
jgi:hypothetical protein